MYTRDGTLTLDVDDLVEWSREQYVKDARKEMREERRAKRMAAEGEEEDAEGEAYITCISEFSNFKIYISLFILLDKINELEPKRPLL